MLVGVQGPPLRRPRHLDDPPTRPDGHDHEPPDRSCQQPRPSNPGKGRSQSCGATASLAEVTRSATAQKTSSQRPQIRTRGNQAAIRRSTSWALTRVSSFVRRDTSATGARAPGHDAERSVTSALSRGESALRLRPRIPRRTRRRERSIYVRQACGLPAQGLGARPAPPAGGPWGHNGDTKGSSRANTPPCLSTTFPQVGGPSPHSSTLLNHAVRVRDELRPRDQRFRAIATRRTRPPLNPGAAMPPAACPQRRDVRL